MDDSNWEPDGVTHHVRFCEGPGVTVGWLRSCGTAGKPGGNREDKHQPVPLGEPGLLTKGTSLSIPRKILVCWRNIGGDVGNIDRNVGAKRNKIMLDTG